MSFNVTQVVSNCEFYLFIYFTFFICILLPAVSIHWNLGYSLWIHEHNTTTTTKKEMYEGIKNIKAKAIWNLKIVGLLACSQKRKTVQDTWQLSAWKKGQVCTQQTG